jgi:hypothetical protein
MRTDATNIARRHMSGMNVFQFDPGFFWMYQAGLQVGQLVTVAAGAGRTEYWYLYASGQGSPPSGYAVYTWPGSQHTAVTTSYSYHGTTPPNWDPNNPSAYKSTLQNQLGPGLTVQYIIANCSAPSMRGSKKKSKLTKGARKKTAKKTSKKKR